MRWGRALAVAVVCAAATACSSTPPPPRDFLGFADKATLVMSFTKPVNFLALVNTPGLSVPYGARIPKPVPISGTWQIIGPCVGNGRSTGVFSGEIDTSLNVVVSFQKQTSIVGVSGWPADRQHDTTVSGRLVEDTDDFELTLPSAPTIGVSADTVAVLRAATAGEIVAANAAIEPFMNEGRVSTTPGC